MQEMRAQHQDTHGWKGIREEHLCQGPWLGGCDTEPFSEHKPRRPASRAEAEQKVEQPQVKAGGCGTELNWSEKGGGNAERRAKSR